MDQGFEQAVAAAVIRQFEAVTTQGLTIEQQTTSFGLFQVQVGISSDQVTYTLLPAAWVPSGDTTGSTTPKDTVLSLLNVQMKVLSIPVATLNATFTTDFSAQTASADITITVQNKNQLTFQGQVGNWQNAAAAATV